MISLSISSLFCLDPLALLITGLVLFIGIVVVNFTFRYMHGSTRFCHSILNFVCLLTSIIVMVCADNLLVLIIAWGLGNALLIKLMIYQPNWQAAKASGILFAKNYLLGFIFVATSFGLFYWVTGHSSVNAIINHDSGSPMMTLALILLLLGAMTQSAIWPFHKWLISSLNSPTPVSAMMHAGLVNGGGFLLARFAPLYLDRLELLNLIFIIGLGTALIGTLFKLIQSDVKRMLACSTMGQMGFMMVQCGLGLFPAAMAHLCWHGMFKAYLFLGSGSAAQEKRLDFDYPPKFGSFVLAMMCGIFGSYVFAKASAKTWLATDTTQFLIIVAFIATTQFSLPFFRNRSLKRLPLGMILTGIIGGLYGLSVHVIEIFLEPLSLMRAQPLNGFHLFGLITLFICWLSFLFLRSSDSKATVPAWKAHLYVKALNASQPHGSTITAHRNHYKI